MADSAQPVNPRGGICAAALVAVLIFGALIAVAWRAGPGTDLRPADWSALRFTVVQALLSSLFSAVLAIPVARALARRRFLGRHLLIALLGAPFILPVIVAVLGLLAIFGRSGWINLGLEALGLPHIQIYGLPGVVLAHVFFNLPLATRLVLQGWQDIPPQQFRLAAQLQLCPRSMVQIIEYPMLRRILPGVFMVIFAICITSFAVALTLGGGPRATTIELAVYQAFRFDFDLGRAALLSAVQLGMTLVIGGLALWLSRNGGIGTGMGEPLRRWDGQNAAARTADGFWIVFAAGFLLLPLCAIVVAGFPGLVALPKTVISAALTSILVAAASTMLMLALALPMAAAVAVSGKNHLELSGMLGLAASPLVIGTGLFILIRPWSDPLAWAIPVTALVNAITVLPFALRILIPQARQIISQYRKPALSIGLQGGPFLRYVFLPGLRPQIGFAAGLAAALSMGDLGVITLFADPDLATLPLQIYRLMGAYRMDTAAAAALLLLLLSFGAFWLCDQGGRRNAEA